MYILLFSGKTQNILILLTCFDFISHHQNKNGLQFQG